MRRCCDDSGAAGTSNIDAARQMLDAGVRHLAVVDSDNVVGVISMRDVFEVLVSETPWSGRVELESTGRGT